MSETVTIRDAIGKDKFHIDLPHRERYKNVINFLGMENVEKCVPFSIDELKYMYSKDKHLNINMKIWDLESGFSCYRENVKPIQSRLRSLLREKGINCYSNAEGVCILKECAKLMIERSKANEKR